MNRFKTFIDRVIRPRSKKAFINTLSNHDSVLDIGCGNNSDVLFKTIAPRTRYQGIDIMPRQLNFEGEEYTESSPEQFNLDVLAQIARNNAVISAHNLEHCNNYEELVRIIAKSTNLNRLFFSFPSSISIHLPKSRYGTLNFYQDPTHNTLPDLKFILLTLQQHGWNIDFVAPSYKPFIPYIIGLLWSPIFNLTGIESPLFGTYSFLGFESVIWATRRNAVVQK